MWVDDQFKRRVIMLHVWVCTVRFQMCFYCLMRFRLKIWSLATQVLPLYFADFRLSNSGHLQTDPATFFGPHSGQLWWCSRWQLYISKQQLFIASNIFKRNQECCTWILAYLWWKIMLHPKVWDYCPKRVCAFCVFLNTSKIFWLWFRGPTYLHSNPIKQG